ncbi:sulfotransferase domain-containing protein [Prochlorococcus sp. AH-716-D13]|nr:sulfotransferase domain-containing protein [Prochlorococcus sp. AH-716-D13]
MINRFSKKIFIHIGYAKTGTTFLQRQIFQKIDSYIVMEHLDALDFFNPIINYDSSIYDEKLVLKEYNKFIKPKNIKNKDGLIISNERLELEGIDVGLIANRLKNLFPNSKILITLREQFDLLQSWYLFKGYSSKYLGKPFKGKYMEINEFIENGIEKNSNNHIMRLQFHTLFNCYSNLFGKENIYILFFEDIVNKNYKLLEKFEDIFGCKINFKINRSQKINFRMRNKELLKHSNYYFNRELSNYFLHRNLLAFFINLPFIFIGKSYSPIIRKSSLFEFNKELDGFVPKISSKNMKFLIKIYAESNKKLENLTYLNFKKRGYLN